MRRCLRTMDSGATTRRSDTERSRTRPVRIEHESRLASARHELGYLAQADPHVGNRIVLTGSERIGVDFELDTEQGAGHERGLYAHDGAPQFGQLSPEGIALHPGQIAENLDSSI